MTTFKILSIDPAVGKDIAVAYFDGNKWQFKTLPLFIERIKNFIKSKDIDFLVIEGQFFARNIKTYGQLLTVRILISTIAVLDNIPVYVIPPQTWQKRIRTKGHQKNKELKILSQNKAINELPLYSQLFIGPNGEDLADAYNIGQFFLKLTPEDRSKYQWLI